MKTQVRKVLAGALAMLLMVAVTPAVAQGPYYFWWLVQDERGEPFTGQNVQCGVYRPNTHASVVLHSTSQLTVGYQNALFSDSNGKLHFWSSSNAPVDVACFYANGGSAQVNKFRVTDHKIVIPRQGGSKIAKFSVNNITTATNQSSGITIPAGAVVRDVIIQNLNPKGVASAYHISVGFAGNHAVGANVNALVNAQALTSPDEWLRPHVTGDFATNHRGVALSRSHGSGAGSYYELPYMVHTATGLDVTYAVSIPGPVGGARLHVFILYNQYHTGINRLGLTN